MPFSKLCLTTICAFSAFAVTGCQSVPATNCAGFVSNSLSPAGTVALIEVDRPGYQRVIGNDRNGQRRGCW